MSQTTQTELRAEEVLLYRVEQACALLACSRTSLYREIQLGRIHTLLIGGKRRITRQALIDYVAAHEPGEPGRPGKPGQK